VATENKDQEPETASASLADGMHFVGNEVLYRVRGQNVDPQAVARSIELSVTRYCPVIAMLGKGRVKYQVNDELQGFRKGDLVLVKGKFVKQINSIYTDGYLAFSRVKGEPPKALPRDCRILEREGTILWEKVG
jgi:hypothetical protein